jgi:hypothetical protein
MCWCWRVFLVTAQDPAAWLYCGSQVFRCQFVASLGRFIGILPKMSKSDS